MGLVFNRLCYIHIFVNRSKEKIHSNIRCITDILIDWENKIRHCVLLWFDSAIWGIRQRHEVH